MFDVELKAACGHWRGSLCTLSTCLAILASGCASSLGNNAGVSLYGTGAAVEMVWSKDHPWASQFSSSPGGYHLYAQFQSGGRPSEQDLGAARLVNPQTMQFSLPATLRSVPESAVCLFVSRSRAEPAVPIRAGTHAGGDTAKFQYFEWEDQVKASSRAAQAEREARALDQAIAGFERDGQAIRSAQDRKKIREPADCRRQVSMSLASDSAPVELVEPAAMPAASQRICVRRAKNMTLDQWRKIAVDVPNAVTWLNGYTAERKTDHTKAQIVRFQQQWTAWSNKIGAGFKPQVGGEDEMLPVVDVIIDALVAWNEGRGQSPAQRAAIARGLLDGYDGCLEDVAKQLRTRYDAWQRAQSNKPERDRLYAEWQVSSCLADLKNQTDALHSLSALIAEARTRRDGLAFSAAPRPPAGVARKPLNNQVCAL